MVPHRRAQLVEACAALDASKVWSGSPFAAARTPWHWPHPFFAYTSQPAISAQSGADGSGGWDASAAAQRPARIGEGPGRRGGRAADRRFRRTHRVPDFDLGFRRTETFDQIGSEAQIMHAGATISTIISPATAGSSCHPRPQMQRGQQACQGDSRPARRAVQTPARPHARQLAWWGSSVTSSRIGRITVSPFRSTSELSSHPTFDPLVADLLHWRHQRQQGVE